jgi:thiamine biosynthesis lipoprotein
MSEPAALVRRDVRAMNSDIELVCTGPRAKPRLERAARWIAAYEERYSRFRVLSELSRLNAASGEARVVSPGLYRLAELSLQFAQRSGGLFDPTVLNQLLAAGYDRSFEQIGPSNTARRQEAPRSGWRDVQLGPATRTITLPRGVGIDLGGIGKGWAVDRLASMLGTPCMVNGGGDIYASGQPPGEDCWRIGVTNPFQPENDLYVLRVADRGVATSSSLKRAWRSGDIVQHHLIDPGTGRPSASDAVQVTVVAPQAVLADYHAKVALLHGAEAGVTYLDKEADVEGVVVSKDGRVLTSSGLSTYL